jgi:hypothetical protein
MKQTAVEKMIQYFIEQKNNGASHWCIDDLIAQLHQAKAMEKEQIVDAYWKGVETELYERPFRTSEQYYNETFKSE